MSSTEFDSTNNASKIDIDFFEKEKQQARCELRERFLRAVTFAVGKQCTFYLYSNTTVSGTFKGNDIEFENILASGLKTPSMEVPSAIIRASDIQYVNFQGIDQ